ncbi:hypothetical protein FPR_22660 [Faecalibacterium prausnitzii SL3/3]|jgi:hypothetical protein|uniref:Uncharacterized protein n=2 Tax=Faecalibacterium prausnitzii TaxID=853 RepID=D4KC82_9FIRM|nr:hypothetical protein FPR_22660 [Faecalibacterium prausnitzii SL3/3]DAN11610.1 MAG TPA: hypothetical protein [Bacteriophage sp.]
MIEVINMTEKDKRVLKYAIDNLIARENNLCEGSCKNNPVHRAERERDRDLIIFGIRDVLCEVERLEEQEKEMLEKAKHEVVQF